jgi:hypothetical protein
MLKNLWTWLNMRVIVIQRLNYYLNVNINCIKSLWIKKIVLSLQNNLKRITMKKKKMIEEIKRVIGEKGMTTSGELELESSPCISSIGNGKNNVSQLVESFYSDKVEAVTYHDEIALCEEFIPYEELKKEIIEEIYDIIVNNYQINEEE